MDQTAYDSLTPMERNCLRLVHHERKAEQIAFELGIRPSTVNSHIFSARRKLGGLSRLSAADQLRQFEASTRPGSDATPPPLLGPDPAETVTPPPTITPIAPEAPPHPLSRQMLGMEADDPIGREDRQPIEVREHPGAFLFEDARYDLLPEQDQPNDEALRRLALILAIAALAVLIVIAAPAVYDSAAQRIANSLERPHVH